jgi:hypothetical protein
VFFFKIVNHGGCQGDMAQALAQWQHLVALHEATDVLHGVMHPTSHRRICMAIEITSFRCVFFVAVNFVVGHNHTLKTMIWS